MPIKLNFTPVVTKEEIKAKKQQKKVEIKEKKETKKRRKYLEDNSLYGTRLFEPIVSKEKRIVVHFPPRFTENRTRISSCGKFAFRPMNDLQYELYYLGKKPILEFGDDLVLEPNDDQILFDQLTIEEVEELVRTLVKIEFQDEKDKLLVQLIEDERQIRLEKDKLEAEEDRLLEETSNDKTNQSTTEQLCSEFSVDKEIESESKTSQTISEQGERQEEKVVQQEDKTSATLPGGFLFKTNK